MPWYYSFLVSGGTRLAVYTSCMSCSQYEGFRQITRSVGVPALPSSPSPRAYVPLIDLKFI